jgi:DNA-binding LytR/AlgR family response regulator
LRIKFGYVKRRISFVNDSQRHFALREILRFGRSSRLWLTFGAVVLLFAITGPFGTDRIAFIPRLAYWFVLHAATWSVALVFALGGEFALRGWFGHMLVRMLLGSLLAAFPIGLVVGILEFAWFGRAISLDSYVREVIVSLPLCGIFCALTYMAMSGEPEHRKAATQQTSAEAMEAAVPETPRDERAPLLLRRLSQHNRGRLQHISVEDHYSKVRTSAGSELVLLRFSDAISEADPEDGMQVHRSHWVARAFVVALRTNRGKTTLALKDGSEVPVSRTFLPEVRRWLQDP